MISIPFPGSKRYAYKRVKAIVEENGYRSVYEPFGGSGVLSVNLKNDGLVEKAVLNDYDHLWDLYPDYLDIKDRIVNELQSRGLYRSTHNCKRGYYRFTGLDEREWESVESPRLAPEWTEVLQGLVSQVDEKYWRLLAIGGNFTHSAVMVKEEIELRDFNLFYSYVRTDKQRDYLEAVKRCDVENLDWSDFMNKLGPGMTRESLLILDPPYAGSSQSHYKDQFDLEGTVNMLRDCASYGTDIIFFGHSPEIVKSVLNGADLDGKLSEVGDLTCSITRNRLDTMAYIRRSND